MKLTNQQIKAAKYGHGKSKLFDGGGLYIEPVKSGSKIWRYKYRLHGKEKRITLGHWPETTLKEARQKHAEARKLVSEGIDPIEERKARKMAVEESIKSTFESIAREWLGKQAISWSKSTLKKTTARLDTYIFPWIGKKPILEINADDLIRCLNRIEEQGFYETARRVKTACGSVFRYAVATNRTERDPTLALRGILAKKKTQSLASITDPAEIGGLLRALESYQGHIVTRWALQLAPLLFVRPGELRTVKWPEIDFDNALWRIPASKMKMKQPHLAPLSHQALEIFTEAQALTSDSEYVFPSVRTNTRPMSENTVTGALRRLGYPSGTMTGHGFRHMASTRLHEMGWRSEVIERQLAHKDPNAVRATYNQAEYLEERRQMMQEWSDYLDKLKRLKPLVD